MRNSITMLILPVKIICTVAFISQIDRLRIYFISKLRFFSLVNVLLCIGIQVGHQCQAHTILLSVYVLFFPATLCSSVCAERCALDICRGTMVCFQWTVSLLCACQFRFGLLC